MPGGLFGSVTVSPLTVWNFSDICNALMAVPNLICVLVLSGKACREIRDYPI
ncbi:MAG: alanine:cation symporter family protein [Lachnospiraceae bacterium]|nr:alanine:cation symporter family protein [Clostridiaceae bacterium]MCI9337031.1 alanine:cation symporter family protein [Lachnospiraceae bacterium]